MVSKKIIYLYFSIFLGLFLVNLFSALYLFEMKEKSFIVNLQVIVPHLLSQGVLVFIFAHLYQFYSEKKTLIYLLFGLMLANNFAVFIDMNLKLFSMIGFYCCLLVVFCIFFIRGMRI